MDIKPSLATGQNTAVSSAQDPASALQQLPRGTALTAIVQSSVSAGQQQANLQTQQGRTSLFNTLLEINGQKVQTQSNQAFTPGQTLKVEVTGNAAIRILESINRPGNESLNQPLLQIQQGLRQSLPIQQNSAVLLNNLIPLFKLLSNNQYNEVKAQIRALLATVPNFKELSNPTTLRQSVTQSGSFFENSLRQIHTLLQQQTAQQSAANPNKNQPTAATPNKVNQEQLMTALRENLQVGKQLDKLATQDFKAQLLKLASNLIPLAARSDASPGNNPAEAALIHRILGALPGTKGNLTAASNQSSLPLSNLPITTQIQQLLLNPALFTGQQQAPQQGNTPATNQSMDLAVSTVLRQIAATLARVQSNQLQSLAAPRSDADGSTLINNWNIEIPVFLEGQFKPIQLQIREERHPSSTETENTKNRQWKITLGFDFEELGEFFATLSIIDNSVSATFWSEQADTLKRISNELQHLNKSLNKLGLNVEELECRRGKPIFQETRLDQQLVDIKT